MRTTPSLGLAAIAFALLAAPGCVGPFDGSPAGSCTFEQIDEFGASTVDCSDNLTAQECSQQPDGHFAEGGTCILFDILSGGPR